MDNSSFDKLKHKIKQDTGLEIENMRRVYGGHVMRASGAWSWISNIVGSNMEVGSSHQVKELLKYKKLKEVNGWSLYQREIVESK